MADRCQFTARYGAVAVQISGVRMPRFAVCGVHNALEQLGRVIDQRNRRELMVCQVIAHRIIGMRVRF